jgi:hypothetical protein
MTKKEFRKNYRKVTGERLKGKQLKDAYQLHKVASSDSRVEFCIFYSTIPTLGENLKGTNFVDELEGYQSPKNMNANLLKLENELKKGSRSSETQFNELFEQVESRSSGINWRIFGFAIPTDGNGQPLPVTSYSHYGTMVINGNTANTTQKKHAALKEMLYRL